MSKVSTEDDNQAVGRRLLAVREQAKLSQAAFAEALGLSHRAYAGYERGEREAPAAVHRALCERFDIDPVWVLSGPESTPRKMRARSIDFHLVEMVTEHLDRRLASIGRKLSREARINVLEALYQIRVDHGSVSDEVVERLIGVAGGRRA